MKTIYWATTGILALFLLWSSYTYFFSKSTIEGVRDLGFPDHFRVLLAILKVIAVLVLVLPQVPINFKEWAYAGVGLFFITAIVAHTAHKDPFFITAINLVLIALLVISNIYLHKMLKL